MIDLYTDIEEMDDYIDGRLEVIPQPLSQALTDGGIIETLEAYLKTEGLTEGEEEIIQYKVFLILLQLYPLDELETELLADTNIDISEVSKITNYISDTLLGDLREHLDNLPDEPFDESILTTVGETSMQDILESGSASTTEAEAVEEVAPEEVPAQNPEIVPEVASPSTQSVIQRERESAPQQPVSSEVTTPTPLRVDPMAALREKPASTPSWNHVEEAPQNEEGLRTMPHDLAAAEHAAKTVSVPKYSKDPAPDNIEPAAGDAGIPSFKKPLT